MCKYISMYRRCKVTHFYLDEYVKNVEYVGRNVSENGRMGVEERPGTQTGANAWRNIEGVTMDRMISRKLEGKVLDS